MSANEIERTTRMDDARSLWELARRARYHGSIERALHDLTEVDQDRLKRAAETILAHRSPTGCS